MLPEAQLPINVRGHELTVDYLGPDDLPWLRALIQEFDRYSGRRERDLRERLTGPLAVPAPLARRRAATAVLWRMWRRRTRSAVPPRQARAQVFTAAAADRGGDGGGRVWDRDGTIGRVADTLAVAPTELEQALFADVPGERVLTSPAEVPAPAELGSRTNLALAQYLVMRSGSMRIRAEGNIRALVRLAKLRGLICTVEESDTRGLPVLELSGPMSIFRRTLLYGRALAEMVPLLAWCPRFHLDVSCLVRRQTATLIIATGAPIFPAREPRRFDSALEERFARDFGRLAPEWDLIREPEPVRVGRSLIFPDFLLRNRRDASRRFLLEIVGFWTREYLERKLSALREAALPNLILCIDEDRNCGESEIPVGARLVPFKRRIDAAAVLAAMTGGKPG